MRILNHKQLTNEQKTVADFLLTVANQTIANPPLFVVFADDCLKTMDGITLAKQENETIKISVC